VNSLRVLFPVCKRLDFSILVDLDFTALAPKRPAPTSGSCVGSLRPRPDAPKPRQEIRMTSSGQPNDCRFAGGPELPGGRHSGLCRLRLCVGGQSRSADLLVRPEPTLSPGVPD